MTEEPEFGTTSRVVERGVRIAALVGGLVLMLLMLLTVYSVVMRYVFNAPPHFTLDASKMLLVPVVFLGLAYCGWTGGHIAVDLIGALGRPSLTRWTDVAVRLLCAALVGLLTWELAGLVASSIEFDEVTNLIELPHYPFVAVMVFGAGLYALVLVLLTLRSLAGKADPPRS